MTEIESMIKNGEIYTEKQCKQFFVKFIFLGVFSVLVSTAGIITIAIFKDETIFTLGCIVGVIGLILLTIYVLISFKYAAKYQLSRHYIKHPEDFNNEVNIK